MSNSNGSNGNSNGHSSNGHHLNGSNGEHNGHTENGCPSPNGDSQHLPDGVPSGQSSSPASSCPGSASDERTTGELTQTDSQSKDRRTRGNRPRDGEEFQNRSDYARQLMHSEPGWSHSRIAKEVMGKYGIGRKLAKQYVRRAIQDKQKEDRIEQVRAMLRLGAPKSDIKKSLSVIWKVRPTTVEKYIPLARERNREVLEITEDDALADSISSWSKRLQDAARRMNAANRTAEDGVKHLEWIRDQMKAVSEDSKLSTEYREAMIVKFMKMEAQAIRQIESAQRTSQGADQSMILSQDRIDRLRGNYAPTKVAHTDSKGNDLPKTVPEPIDPEKAINELAQKLRDRGVGGPVIPKASQN